MEDNFGYEQNEQGTDDANDYGGNYHYQFEPASPPPKNRLPVNGFTQVSLLFGILALVTGCCFYISIPAAALGILFGILSRTGPEMIQPSKAGLTLSILALCLSACLTVIMLTSLFRNQEFQSQYERYIESYMGEDLENLPNDFPHHDKSFPKSHSFSDDSL